MPKFISVLPSTGDCDRLGTCEPDRPPSLGLLPEAALAAQAAGFAAALVATGHTNNHFGDQAGYVDSLVTASALAPVTSTRRLLVAPSQRGASHYAYWDRHGFGEALCGFTFTREDGVTAIAGEPSCPECVREKRLAEEMRPG
jgi:hypothetical protein